MAAEIILQSLRQQTCGRNSKCESTEKEKWHDPVGTDKKQATSTQHKTQGTKDREDRQRIRFIFPSFHLNIRMHFFNCGDDWTLAQVVQRSCAVSSSDICRSHLDMGLSTLLEQRWDQMDPEVPSSLTHAAILQFSWSSLLNIHTKL